MIEAGFLKKRKRSRFWFRKWRRGLSLFVLMTLIFVAATVFTRSRFFVVSDVSFFWPGSDVAVKDVENLIENELRGRKIWQSSAVLTVALAAFPVLEKMEIQKIWPRGVRVLLWRKQPAIVWRLGPEKVFFDKVNQAAQAGATSSGRQRLASLFERLSATPEGSFSAYLVDGSGKIFERKNSAPETFLPEILSDSPSPRLGDFLSPRGQNLLRFAQVYVQAGWASYGGRVVYLLSLEEADLVFLEKKTSLLLPIETQGRESFEALGLILKKYAIEGKTLKYVDLRFKNPVVQY